MNPPPPIAGGFGGGPGGRGGLERTCMTLRALARPNFTARARKCPRARGAASALPGRGAAPSLCTIAFGADRWRRSAKRRARRGHNALPVRMPRRLLLAALVAVLMAPLLFAGAGTITSTTATTATMPTLERVAVLSATAAIETSDSSSSTVTANMTLTGTKFPALPPENITVVDAAQNICVNVVRVSSTEVTCQYPVAGELGCTRQKVTLSFNGVPALTTTGREGDSNRICYVDSFETKVAPEHSRANPWETNWTFNIILITSGGFAALILLWLIMRWLVSCCRNCCGNGKYVPPESSSTGGSGSTKVALTLHRIATCEDSLSELKLARAAWSITEPAPRLDPPPTKSEESDIDQKLWSLAE